MYRVSKKFSACENGVDITTYDLGDYETLPPNALVWGVNIGAVEELPSGEKIEQSNLPAGEGAVSSSDESDPHKSGHVSVNQGELLENKDLTKPRPRRGRPKKTDE